MTFSRVPTDLTARPRVAFTGIDLASMQFEYLVIIHTFS